MPSASLLRGLRGAKPVQTQLEHKAFRLLLALVSVAFAWLLLPFYGAVFWAVILAIVFQPLQRAFEHRLGAHSNLAAALSVFVCIVIAIIPMTLIVGALAPWLLLVGLPGVLHSTSAACIAGSFPA